jgi:hypothetical protein
VIRRETLVAVGWAPSELTQMVGHLTEVSALAALAAATSASPAPRSSRVQGLETYSTGFISIGPNPTGPALGG